MAAEIDEDYLAYNFQMPTYTKFFKDTYGSIYHSCSQVTLDHFTPGHLFQVMSNYGDVSTFDIAVFFLMAVGWTIIRQLVTIFIFVPLFKKCHMGKQEEKKSPESAWKFLFYTSTWCYSIYLLFFSKYDFFFNSPLTFYKWKVSQPIPLEIYVFYMIQLSFYLHSVYGTLYMDVWRKDSVVMLLHHFVTLLLIGFSYAFRFSNIGILILFLHDVTDVILEFTKLVLYQKSQGGKWTKICDVISTIGFVVFGVCWYVFRLYWFPLKAIYAAGYTSTVVLGREPPFYLFFNILLTTLLIMNIYWFKFIVVMAYYVVTGRANEVEDVREYEESTLTKQSKVLDEKRINGTRKNGLSKKHR